MLPIEGQPILTAAQMKAAEIASGIDLFELMTRAGEGVARETARLAAGAEVLVLCGPGNNGGDGYVAAAALRWAGLAVRVAATGEPATDLARRARAGWDGPVEPLGQAEPAPIIVDALFGTGLARPLGPEVASAFALLAGAARLAIAVDLPSGVDADTGRLLGPVPSVALTLALGALKPAHGLYPAAGRCGAVRLLEIGVPVERAWRFLQRPPLRVPGPNDHKFTRGMVAVIGGRMPGASALAATAAARSGAGYVLLLGGATDRLPHAVVRRSWTAEALADPRIGAVVVGPGLGRDAAAEERLAAALACARPLVIDGDALRLLAPDMLAGRAAGAVLTPHAGEFAHLFGADDADKITATLAAARRSGAVIVQKGADTVIAGPGGEVRLGSGGFPWLATAGTGDVLAGAIGAMLAAGLAPLDAAEAGVWLHGEAARCCGAAFIADDLAAALTPARAAL
jgi:ADP-dependent NAD(P)H-hydrate dehydratase / NAD(P)H-hydrate epimerase